MGKNTRFLSVIGCEFEMPAIETCVRLYAGRERDYSESVTTETLRLFVDEGGAVGTALGFVSKIGFEVRLSSRLWSGTCEFYLDLWSWPGRWSI